MILTESRFKNVTKFDNYVNRLAVSTSCADKDAGLTVNTDCYSCVHCDSLSVSILYTDDVLSFLSRYCISFCPSSPVPYKPSGFCCGGTARWHQLPVSYFLRNLLFPWRFLWEICASVSALRVRAPDGFELDHKLWPLCTVVSHYPWLRSLFVNDQ